MFKFCLNVRFKHLSVFYAVLLSIVLCEVIVILLDKYLYNIFVTLCCSFTGLSTIKRI